MLRKRTLASVGLALVLLLSLVPLTMAQMTPGVEVSDQALSETNTYTIDSVVSNGAGFIVIHRNACTDADGNNTFGEVIGHVAVQDGENTDVDVTLDEGVQVSEGDSLCAMLHTDDNEQGTYEFGQVEGADAPVTQDGSIVMDSFAVGAMMQEATPTATAEPMEEMTPTATAESMEAMTPTATSEAPETMPETGAADGNNTGLLLGIAGILALLLGGALYWRRTAGTTA